MMDITTKIDNGTLSVTISPDKGKPVTVKVDATKGEPRDVAQAVREAFADKADSSAVAKATTRAYNAVVIGRRDADRAREAKEKAALAAKAKK